MEGNGLTGRDRLVAIANDGRPGAGARRRPRETSRHLARHGWLTALSRLPLKLAVERVRASEGKRSQGGCMRSVSDLGVRRSGVAVAILLQALAGCSDPNGPNTGAIEVTVTTAGAERHP